MYQASLGAMGYILTFVIDPEQICFLKEPLRFKAPLGKFWLLRKIIEKFFCCKEPAGQNGLALRIPIQNLPFYLVIHV